MVNLGVAELTVTRRQHRSVVSKQFGKAPLQVHQPLYLENADYPVVYLRTPSSGLLDGDVHEINVCVETDAALELRTQAATLVYPGASSLAINVQLCENAAFTYTPHPLILAAGADFTQSVRISLSNNSKLHYRESWCAGRIAMQECWQFRSFRNVLVISNHGALQYRENWKLEPDSVKVTHPFLCDEYTHFASTYLFGQEVAVPEQAIGARCWTMRKDGATIHRVASK